MKTFKRLLAIVLTAALLLTVIPVGTYSVFAAENTTEFAGGDGTAEKPYLISTKEHLNNVRFYLSSNFKMIKDIVFDEKDFQEGGDYYNDGNGWEPIGFSNNKFTGDFDGNFYRIVNLKMCSAQECTGLFGATRSATIKNVTIINSNVSVADSAPSTNYTGTLVGRANNTTVQNCYVDGITTGATYYTGNIIASAEKNTKIKQCISKGKVYGGYYVGGICGSAGYDTTIEMCCNQADIEGTECGGIAGMAGTNKSGDVISTTRISDCYNTGSIKNNNSNYTCGGIVGCFATYCKLYPDYAIKNCYSCGDANTVNGYALLGRARNTGYVTSCHNSFYLSGIGAVYSGSDEKALTSDQMRSQGSFTGWDFDTVWTMAGDKDYLYPELQCFTLRGNPTIKGSVAYNETVSADLSGLNTLNDTISYAWTINGNIVAENSDYKIKESDIDKKLKLEVISSHPLCYGNAYSNEITILKGKQPSSPAVPVLVSKDDKSFEISTVSTQEYSTDNKNWQAGGKFDNLDPNKEYTVYSRILENNLYFTGESKEVLKVTTDRRPLSGTVAIVGTSRYGDTLSADVSAVLPANATYSYEWKSGGAVVGTNSTYTVVKNDIGKVITVSVKGTKNFIGTVTSAGVTATKTTVQTPAAPTVADKTNVTVTLTEKSGCEYSKDKANWQDSTVFTGLSAATEYTFYQRIKATETTFASSASNGTKVTTLKNSILAPASPTVASKTNTSVTLKAESGFEYSKDGLTWQKSNIFTGLNPNTEYSFCQRIAENETDYASATSEFTSVVTLKNSVVAPSAPTVKTATANSVTLNAISGYEYSKDGTTWQKSNTFNGLVLFDTYDFYQRIAETDTDYASPASKALPFKVKNVVSKPNKPTLKEKTNSKIEVIGTQGYEYSIDGKNWVINTVFTGLNPNQTYSVYCRIPETDTEYASDASDALTVTTLKNTVSKPSAPITSSVKDTSVTLTANSNYEFSKDGITWQKSNTFTGLSPNKEYTFYQRIAETNTTYASEKSDGKKVTTLKSTVNVPAAPTLSSKADVSITLIQKVGYEYSKDGIVWQTSNVFTGLSANTEYSFYQRIAETDTTYASSKSDALKVTTYKHTQATTPTAPTVKKAYATSIILYYIDGYEYSKNGTTWQKDNVFTGLSANTEYTFYQRIAETNTTYASAKSSVLKVKTVEKATCSIAPIKPIITGYTTSSVTLYALDGYEYSKNGTTWQSSTTFSELSANTTYTFYQRIKETADEKASDKSVGVSVKTAKNVQASDWSTVPGSLSYNYKMVEDYIKKSSNTDTAGNKYVYWQNNNKTISLKITLYPDGLQFSSTASAYDNYDHLTEVLYFRISDKSNSFVTHFYVDYMISFNTGMITDDDKTLTKSEITKSSYYQRYKTGTGVSSTTFTEMYNDTLQNTLNTFDTYLYGLFGFGFKGLGFTKYAGYGTTADNSCNHSGSTEIRGKRDATCTIPGYTGDVYCTTCGEKISSGTTIPCTGHHTYDNSCDNTCNVCGEMRYIEHTYSSDCDCECDICHTRRVAPKEHDFGEHEFIKEKCICGAEKFTYGDVNGDNVIDATDLVRLKKYLAGQPVEITEGADCNGDNTVDATDLVRLKKYLAGQPVVLGK